MKLAEVVFTLPEVGPVKEKVLAAGAEMDTFAISDAETLPAASFTQA